MSVRAGFGFTGLQTKNQSSWIRTVVVVAIFAGLIAYMIATASPALSM